jgi:diguanylate cyclase (GGDEF)-like protein
VVARNPNWFTERLRATAEKLTSSIAVRLAAVVLITGTVALGVIGALTMLRLDIGLKEQAQALDRLSEEQLAYRLDGEVQLARARLDALGAEVARDLRLIARHGDIGKALGGKGDTAIPELLRQISKSLTFDGLLAFDTEARLVGVFPAADLPEIQATLHKYGVTGRIRSLLAEADPSRPAGTANTRPVSPELLHALDRPARLTIAHEAIEPVLDNAGRTIGAMVAYRILEPTERTFERFSSLTNAGVIIRQDGQVVSAAGPKFVTFSRASSAITRKLTTSDDGKYVARCMTSETGLQICTFTDASLVTATRDQLYRLGAEQTRSLMWQFLIFATMALMMLVCALLVSVRRSTRGLSRLASAAIAVANGNLEVPFRATGVGEVYSLGLAFERMLANLRGSMGRIRQLAFYDTVTGLPNREKLRLDAPAIINEMKTGALLFLDLDGFKAINDTFGHKTGDAVLANVASRLSAFIASRSRTKIDVFPLARVGGDEFAAILPGIASQEEAADLAAELIALVRQPFDVGGSHMMVGTSIGITLFPADGRSYEELLINADLAMYAAKSKGRNTFAFFTREIAEIAKERVEIENDLKQAVQNNALEIRYQPQISCYDGSIRGVEALVRWNHPRLGWLTPNKFIGVAEETGLIAEIGRFVLRTALRDIGSLISSGMDLIVSVNSSALEIEDALFANSVKDIVAATDFPAPRLELEITESMAMHDPATVCERIESLRELGVRFAIDDFGTGYSNLATLARLPFDTVKLDRSLISGIATNAEKQSIVRITLDLAKELGFDTVVEGVETQEEFKFVADAGATLAQGFLFSAPVPFRDLVTLLRPGSLAHRTGLFPKAAQHPRSRATAA